MRVAEIYFLALRALAGGFLERLEFAQKDVSEELALLHISRSKTARNRRVRFVITVKNSPRLRRLICALFAQADKHVNKRLLDSSHRMGKLTPRRLTACGTP